MSLFSFAKNSIYGRLGFAIADLFGKKRGSKVEEPAPNIEGPTTKEGTLIPVLFGTRDIKEPVLAWYGGFKKQDSKYYLSAIFILCYGKISKLSRIAYGDKLIWSGINAGLPSDSSILKNRHFSDGAGLYGNFTLDNGGNIAPVDSFSSALTGVKTKYNKLAHLILKDSCIGDVASLKQPTFRITCLGDEKNVMSWNASNVEIFTPEKLYTNISETPSSELNDWDTSLIAIRFDEPYNINIELDYKFSDVGNPPQGTSYDVGFIFQKGLTNDEISQRITNEEFDYITTFTGTSQFEGSIEVPSEKMDVETGGTGIMRVFRFIRVSAYDPTIQTTYLIAKTPALSDINPAHIIYYAITSKMWGMGYGTSDVDEISFNYAAEKLKSEGLGLSILWSKDSTIEELIDDVLKHIDGVLFVDRKTGKFKLNLNRKDYNIALLTVLDSSNIESVTNFKRTSSDDLYNTVTVTYYDTLLGSASGVTVSDSAMVMEQGRTVATKLDFPGISNSTVAKQVAMRELIAISSRVEACTIIANTAAKDLDIGDAFILDYPKYTNGPTVYRVGKISFGDGINNAITIEAVSDVTI